MTSSLWSSIIGVVLVLIGFCLCDGGRWEGRPNRRVIMGIVCMILGVLIAFSAMLVEREREPRAVRAHLKITCDTVKV